MPFFRHKNVNLHYYKYGNGPAVMFAFHGFGMRGTQFEVLVPALEEQYTIYSFDLFFHGKTELYKASVELVRKGLSVKEFGQSMLEFMKTIGAEGKKISLLSYSIGSLMAWSLIETMPRQIDAVFFIAPDGIEPNKLLKMGSQNPLVNRLFYQLVYRPKTVMFALRTLNRFHYIDGSLFRILSREFESTETRLTCYNAITYYSRMSFDADSLAHRLNSNAIRSYFYFGKEDKLFPARIGYAFAEKLKRVNLHVFEAGHELVNESLTELMKEQLMKDPISVKEYDKG